MIRALRLKHPPLNRAQTSPRSLGDGDGDEKRACQAMHLGGAHQATERGGSWARVVQLNR